MRRASTQFDEVLYYQPGLQIGRFWLPVAHENFEDTGAIENHLLVIPTWAIEISYFDHAPVVADPTRAMCYNRGCEYRRRALNPHGDLALWIAYEDEALAESVGGTPEAPFRRRWAPLPNDAFLAARSLNQMLTRGELPDPMALEETAWWLLERCHSDNSPGTEVRATRRQQRTVANAEALIAERYTEPLTLSQLAGEVFCSPFHLCRLFKRLTGTSIHQRLNSLRLRDAVPAVMEGDESLTQISAELGFASLSHFSAAFRQAFGVPPSRLRKSPGGFCISPGGRPD